MTGCSKSKSSRSGSSTSLDWSEWDMNWSLPVCVCIWYELFFIDGSLTFLTGAFSWYVGMGLFGLLCVLPKACQHCQLLFEFWSLVEGTQVGWHCANGYHELQWSNHLIGGRPCFRARGFSYVREGHYEHPPTSSEERCLDIGLYPLDTHHYHIFYFD